MRHVLRQGCTVGGVVFPFPHLCPGDGCAVCAYVAVRTLPDHDDGREARDDGRDTPESAAGVGAASGAGG